MSLSKIHVWAAKGDVQDYQGLLRADWSRETLSEALQLLHKVIARSLRPASCSWQRALTLGPGKKSARDYDAHVLTRIRDLSLVLRESSVPAMPEGFPAGRPSRLAAQTEQTWAYLTLQAMARLEGAIGFFADLQSLLYLCAVHFLLPQLQQHGLAAEHDCLACAMYVHTFLVWKSAPAHLFDLQEALMDYLGDTEQQLRLLDYSFLLTAPEDHAYLTRATAYWSALMEQGRHDEAWRFLRSLARQAPDSCQEEVQEMLAETAVEVRNGAG